MNDCTGRELKVGDKVVFTDEHFAGNLQQGEVAGFTPQKVRINHFFKLGNEANPNYIYGYELRYPEGFCPILKFTAHVCRVG